jgi:spore coat polysaccharide biosynthesis protein SpsF
MTSSRLPGKVLMPLLGRPMLGQQLDRLRRCRSLDAIMIATTDRPTDDPVVAFCEREGVPSHRGSEHDVLSRFAGAAQQASADVVLRATADCPLIDPGVVDACVERFLDPSSSFDYVSNCIVRTFPRGMDTEVFTRAALDAANREATDPSDREHVTPFLYRHPERFQLGSYTRDTDESRYRLTVDTQADFDLIDAIFRELLGHGRPMELLDILALLRARPDLVALNAHVEQKAHTV